MPGMICHIGVCVGIMAAIVVVGVALVGERGQGVGVGVVLALVEGLVDAGGVAPGDGGLRRKIDVFSDGGDEASREGRLFAPAVLHQVLVVDGCVPKRHPTRGAADLGVILLQEVHAQEPSWAVAVALDDVERDGVVDLTQTHGEGNLQWGT